VKLAKQLARYASPVFAVVGLFGIAPHVRAQSPDTQHLIGEWSGSWVGGPHDRLNGDYYLTIQTVEGNIVTGKGQFVGKRTTDFVVHGVLDGNRLSYGDTVLTVDGDHMTGISEGNLALRPKISLTKQK
jgi:hypothetical protein